jgi:hypothetical protein
VGVVADALEPGHRGALSPKETDAETLAALRQVEQSIELMRVKRRCFERGI